MQVRPSVFVTGASGFVGQALCRALLERRVAVRGAIRDVVSWKSAVHLVHVGEVDGATNWAEALLGASVVVHLAARVHLMREKASDPLTEFRKVNVAGTLNFARQAAEAGVNRFVYLSSIKVNGETTAPGQAFRAEDAPAPEDAYAISKHEAEIGLLTIAKETGMEVVIIRPPLVYGPGVKGNFASLVKWVRKGIPLPLGALNNKRSLVALDNLVSFIALCVDHEMSPAAANSVFLISDVEDISTTELLNKVARAYGKKGFLLPVPEHWLHFAAGMLGKADVANRLLGSLVVDGSPARERLGWRPVVTMEEQLQKMARHDSLL